MNLDLSPELQRFRTSIRSYFESEYPKDILDAAKAATVETMEELSAKNEISAQIVASYTEAAKHLDPWSKVSVRAFLSARG